MACEHITVLRSQNKTKTKLPSTIAVIYFHISGTSFAAVACTAAASLVLAAASVGQVLAVASSVAAAARAAAFDVASLAVAVELEFAVVESVAENAAAVRLRALAATHDYTVADQQIQQHCLFSERLTLFQVGLLVMALYDPQ